MQDSSALPPFIYSCPPSSLFPYLRIRQSSRVNGKFGEGEEDLFKTMLCLPCPLPMFFVGWAELIQRVVPDSLQPYGLWPARFLCPWDSPGKNTGVGCHFLLQCMKVKSQSEVTQSCPTLPDPMDCSPPGSSIHGIFQARVLEWGAIAFSEDNVYKVLISTLSCSSVQFSRSVVSDS